MTQLTLLSGREIGREVAEGVQLENPAEVPATVPDRQTRRAAAEVAAVLEAHVALSSPKVRRNPAPGHRNDRVAKAERVKRTSERNHLIQRESVIGEERKVATGISDRILRSSGRVVSQRLISCPIAMVSTLADLFYSW